MRKRLKKLRETLKKANKDGFAPKPTALAQQTPPTAPHPQPTIKSTQTPPDRFSKPTTPNVKDDREKHDVEPKLEPTTIKPRLRIRNPHRERTTLVPVDEDDAAIETITRFKMQHGFRMESPPSSSSGKPRSSHSGDRDVRSAPEAESVLAAMTEKEQEDSIPGEGTAAQPETIAQAEIAIDESLTLKDAKQGELP